MKKKLLCFATSVALLSFPSVNFAQTINLGTARDFVLFTTVGAVTNDGITHATGNVGSNVGSSTGFGNVNGVMHSQDGATAQAAADLLTAYNTLNSTIPTQTLASPLGNGVTLFAGVYSIAGPTVLSSDLILDAQGNANAVFIFKIGGAFSTDVAAKVKLVNGALACNVYWKVEGAVGLASKTFIRGSIIANAGAITMNVGDTLEGRALSIGGAVGVDGILAYTPTGCGSTILTGPAAPSLVSSACFAVFSGNGSVSNAGISNVTGDVGTNVGLTTGYNPLNVNGTIHPIADGATSAAASDLLNAYSYLNTLPNDIELLFPAQFGNNLVLTPHTYIMNGAAFLKDTLYLNGEGYTDAVFVIKVNGALSTSVLSKVLLINGTQAKNVFWKVEGAVEINDYSVFVGTIIANNGALSLKTGVAITGRALTTNGALSTSAINSAITSPVCQSTLPVDWLYFRGNPVRQKVLLEWATTNEMNNGFFTIEKSKDGSSFKTLTTVSATKVTGTAERSYAFTDDQPYSLGYYRISQTDKDGQINNYRTIQVKLSMDQSLQARHYVQGNYIYVQTSGAVPGNGSITLFSIDGKKLSTQKIILTREAATFKIVKSLQKGIYVIYIESRGEKLYHGKVMVQ